MTTREEQWEQDKATLIANFLVLLYPGLSHEEYIELAEPLFALERDELFRLMDEAMMTYLPRSTPLRKMVRGPGEER